MGLLSDPSIEGSLLGQGLLKHSKLLSCVLYIAGVAWFFSLAHNSMNHGTYFSENALLPGLVQGEFRSEARMNRYLQELTREAERHPDSIPIAWFLGKFTQLGFDTYTHNFTLEDPMATNRSFTGTQVYGILRAPRASSTEALVVSAPYRPPSSPLPPNTPALALMLALGHFFADQVYWSKDVIFLVSAHEQLGAEAWLRAYHGVEGGVLRSGEVEGRAGAIQANINLELSDQTISHLDIRYEGLNGQLPNLDLVNLLHRLCQRESLRHTTSGRKDHPRPLSTNGFLHQLKTLASSMATQATGVPTGNHGLFLRYGIAAVTVASGARGRAKRGGTLLQVGRVMEGVLRSLNNLMERFHQSFFFYLLPATNRYISIGVYMPPFGLIAAPLLLTGLALWVSAASHARAEAPSPVAPSPVAPSPVGPSPVAPSPAPPTTLLTGAAGPSTGPTGSGQPPAAPIGSPPPPELAWHGSHSLLAALPALLCQLGPAACCALLPRPLVSAGRALGLPADTALLLGLTAYCLCLLATPLFCARSPLPPPCHHLLLSLTSLHLATLACATAVLNFPLALALTLLYAPAVIFLRPAQSRAWRWLGRLLLLLLHPLLLLAAAACLDTLRTFPSLPLAVLLPRAVGAIKSALMFAATDAQVYGNWLFVCACVCLLPAWQCLWHCLSLPPHVPAKLKAC